MVRFLADRAFQLWFFAMNYAIIFLGFGGGGLLVGMSVKSALPVLAPLPSDAVRRVFGLLAAQAVLVFLAWLKDSISNLTLIFSQMIKL